MVDSLVSLSRPRPFFGRQGWGCRFSGRVNKPCTTKKRRVRRKRRKRKECPLITLNLLNLSLKELSLAHCSQQNIRQIVSRFGMIFTVILMSHCAQDNLNNFYDEYQGFYGLTKPIPNPSHAALIGRLSYPDQTVAEGVEVYLNDEALPARSNHLGGFTITRIPPGEHWIYARSRDGFGFARKVLATPQHVIEWDKAELHLMADIHGTVRTDEITAGETRIRAIGTPFRTQAREDGRFRLSLPKGRYQIEYAHFAYRTHQSDPVDIGHEHVNLGETELELRPVPTAQASLKGLERGFLARGDDVEITFSGTPEIIGMQLIDARGPTSPEALGGINKIQRFRSTLRIPIRGEGMQAWTWVFSDPFGRTSQAVTVTYYGTLLGPDWIYLYGPQPGIQRILGHQKVAFIHPQLYPPMGSIPVHSPAWSETPSTNLLPPNYSETFASTGPYFEEDVIIEAGAQVHGSAHFQGTLRVLGTEDNPVLWDLNNQDLFINTQVDRLKHAHLQNGRLRLQDHRLDIVTTPPIAGLPTTEPSAETLTSTDFEPSIRPVLGPNLEPKTLSDEPTILSSRFTDMTLSYGIGLATSGSVPSHPGADAGAGDVSLPGVAANGTPRAPGLLSIYNSHFHQSILSVWCQHGGHSEQDSISFPSTRDPNPSIATQHYTMHKTTHNTVRQNPATYSAVHTTEMLPDTRPASLDIRNNTLEQSAIVISCLHSVGTSSRLDTTWSITDNTFQALHPSYPSYFQVIPEDLLSSPSGRELIDFSQNTYLDPSNAASVLSPNTWLPELPPVFFP